MVTGFKGEQRPEAHPFFMFYVIILMIYEKGPCVKVCGVPIISHEVMKLQSFKSSMTHLNQEQTYIKL